MPPYNHPARPHDTTRNDFPVGLARQHLNSTMKGTTAGVAGKRPRHNEECLFQSGVADLKYARTKRKDSTLRVGDGSHCHPQPPIVDLTTEDPMKKHKQILARITVLFHVDLQGMNIGKKNTKPTCLTIGNHRFISEKCTCTSQHTIFIG